MTPLLLAQVIPAVLFLILAGIKKAVGWRYCALCLAIGGTWLSLLILYMMGRFAEPRVLAVLMGESAVGVYFLLEKRLNEKWQIFRAPFLLTLTYLVLLVVGVSEGALYGAGLLAGLWLLFILIYLFRGKQAFKEIFERIIACCRDW